MAARVLDRRNEPIFSDRPESQYYTEFEDDDSEVEQSSLKSSIRTIDARRRSNTTISSYEVPTPQSEKERPFEVLIKPVSGPTGPHLFRSSQLSAEFTFEPTLQLSPVDEPIRAPTAFSQETVTRRPQLSRSCSRRSSSPVPARIPGLPNDVNDWTTLDVVDWMYSLNFEMPLIERFEANDIDGAVLVEMHFEDLKELGIQSFGKRHQLWSAICILTAGESLPSPVPTPFQDIVRCISRREELDRDNDPGTPCSGGDVTPISPEKMKKRRGRKARNDKSKRDEASVEQPVSIIAIEEHIPRPHVCSKGAGCSKWRRQQRQFGILEHEYGWPVSPVKRGFIRITGDPGNAITAPNILPGVHAQEVRQEVRQEARYSEDNRPTSEIAPSVVPSSALFGPGQLPEFALHEEQLQQLERTDPNENIKQFLKLQHIPPPSTRPATPPLDMFPDEHFEMFPTQVTPPVRPSTTRPCLVTAKHDNLKALPKLCIPQRAATASPSMAFRKPALKVILSPTTESMGTPVTMYRYGTPASEMGIPVTTPTLGPVSRDASQSVPPNMHYRDPSPITRSQSRTDWRRPSFALPSLKEREETTPTTTPTNRSHTSLSTSQVAYGLDCTHAGWMKKRKTKLLRHDWHDAHFRLRGTSLAMHAEPVPSSAALDTINVDKYSVACASAPGNSKLSAALKTLGIREDKKSDGTAFAFQLVPEINGQGVATGAGGGLKRSASVRDKGVKTHHFAVGNRDERIDWMRELMLAKAKGQREKGFVVKVNGK
ncbi:hypothetical protein MBLNU457_g2920t1 [Dothideomycetes sp. NU457]